VRLDDYERIKNLFEKIYTIEVKSDDDE